MIDVHSHIYPRSYLQRLKNEERPPRVVERLGQEYLDIFPSSPRSADAPPPARPLSSAFWSVEAKLAFMDEWGILHAVLSVGNPWIDWLPPPEAIEWASRLNDELEAICAGSRGRFSGLAVLPLADPSASRAEIRRLDYLPHLRGVVLPASPSGHSIDDPRLSPVWEALAERGTVVVLHPHHSLDCADLTGYGNVLRLSLGFPFETSTAIIRLILAGTLDRYPDLQLVLMHGGGTVPFLAGRLDAYSREANLPRAPSAYLRNVYVDGLVYHAAALRCAIEVIGIDRVLFGTDHPFGIDSMRAQSEALKRTLRHDEERALGQVNAARLFGVAVPA